MGICFSVGIPCDRCLGFTTRNGGYLWEFESNLKKLEDANRKLFELANDVINRVHTEEQRGQTERLKNVEQWFERVVAAEDEVKAILEDSFQQTRSLCLGGFCSKHCISSYKFRKRVDRQFLVVAHLKEQGAGFKEAVSRLPDDPVEEIPDEQDTSSTEVIERLPDDPLEEIIVERDILGTIWQHLTNYETKLLGLTGIGGVGKSFELKQIYEYFCWDRKGFNLVIWVDELNDHPVQKIQNEIGKRIDLYDESWETAETSYKEQQIRLHLSKKNFLLLLDDVCEPLRLLAEVGVPRCYLWKKIVFTTRSRSNCNRVRNVEVGCLDPEQAWEFFCAKVGKVTLESHPYIPHLAKTVAKACEGLPLALKTVGLAMSLKRSPRAWVDAIKVLKRSANEFPGVESDVLQLLKRSYDSVGLKGRSCFLYCILYPKYYKISKRDLIDYWTGEGFLKESQETQHEGDEVIGELLNAYLLEEAEDGDHVRLHGLIYEMALWIATRKDEHEKFFVAANAELTQLPQTARWEKAQRMSAMENRIKYLSQTPNSAHLRTLFLNSNNLQKVSSGFFLHMPSLKALNLSNNPLTVLPEEIAELVSLEHLDLSRTNIRKLSEKLKALKKLTCLNLEYTFELHTIPKNLMSSFSMLQVLRMMNCGSGRPKRNSLLFDNGYTLIMELLHLRMLKMLSINLVSSKTLRMFSGSQVLLQSTQSLCLQSVDEWELFRVSMADMRRLDALYLSKCEALEKLVIPQTFDRLLEVVISSCLKDKDLTGLAFAWYLKRLVVSDCPEMEEIISIKKYYELKLEDPVEENYELDPEEKTPFYPFYSLEYLELQELPKLRSIHGDALPFRRLKEIKVVQCSSLKELPLDSHNTWVCKFVIQGERSWWNNLKWRDPDIQRYSHRFFKNVQ